MYTRHMSQSKQTHNLKAYLGILLIILLFILVAYVSQNYNEGLKALVENNGALGMLSYCIITAVAVVIAPISSIPLLPLASMLWGWKIAALLSIIGWVIGSQIAFELARRYGKPLIQKLISLKRLEELEGTLPKQNIFWFVVFLRMLIPVDVLSYALGLFSKIQSIPFFFTTLLGVTPFAFIFAYTGTLPWKFQIFFLLGIGVLLTLIWTLRPKQHQ